MRFKVKGKIQWFEGQITKLIMMGSLENMEFIFLSIRRQRTFSQMTKIFHFCNGPVNHDNLDGTTCTSTTMAC